MTDKMDWLATVLLISIVYWQIYIGHIVNKRPTTFFLCELTQHSNVCKNGMQVVHTFLFYSHTQHNIHQTDLFTMLLLHRNYYPCIKHFLISFVYLVSHVCIHIYFNRNGLCVCIAQRNIFYHHSPLIHNSSTWKIIEISKIFEHTVHGREFLG